MINTWKNKMGQVKVQVSLLYLIVNLLTAIQDSLATKVTNPVVSTAYLDGVRVGGGWTEISKRWPLDSQNGYFIANTKGFHPIEIAIPVEELSSDLEMRFEYWFDYRQVQPTMEVVPCRTKEDLMEMRSQWHEHKIKVNKEDCAHRNMLAYNVLLHDDDDVFAWRLLEISSVITTDEDKTRKPDWQELLTTELAPQTTLRPNEPAFSTVNPIDGETTTSASHDDATSTQVPQTSTETLIPSTTSLQSDTTSTSQDPLEIGVASTTTTELPPYPERRGKRFSGWFGRAKCTPISCNRNLFQMTNYRTVLHGLPPVESKQLEEGKNFYLSNGEKPFELIFESSDDLSEVNSCLDLQIYMEADTSLEFFVQENPDQDRSLELIERKSTDSSCNKWESFKRCINDYLPKLRLPSNDSHTVRFRFQPKSSMIAGKQIGMLFDPNTVSYTKKTYPIHGYLPNVLSLPSEMSVDEYWILDHDGLMEPQLAFESGSESTSERKLRISHIDPTQKHFDLVSRWVEFDDDTLKQGNPLLFIYMAEREDWIESIDFGFQSANSDLPEWVSQKIYTSSDSSTGEKVIGNEQDAGARKNLNSFAYSKANDLIPLPPIKLKGLSKGEFRVRLRHHLRKHESEIADAAYLADKQKHLPLSNGHQLVIRGLAFGDLCAQSIYCKNQGKCTPLGAARAQCTCPAGYSGENCEKVNHCLVHYGSQTGGELCASIGAKCLAELPVFRCHWPNDEYYECKALYKVGEKGELLVEPASNSSQVAMWKEKAQSQSRLIIVLSVFMFAMLLFSVVIVANLVSRLLKSRKTLKGAQMEVVELSRRPQPGSSGVGGFGVSGRPKSTEPASISYSNRSFDASG